MAKKKNDPGANTDKNTKGSGNLKPPWKPGQSGNPSGRPKKKHSVSAVVQEILDAKCELCNINNELRYEGKTKLQALFERLWEAAMAKGDMQAARLLLEYGYGKPAQTVALTSDAPFKIQVVAEDTSGGSTGSSTES